FNCFNLNHLTPGIAKVLSTICSFCATGDAQMGETLLRSRSVFQKSVVVRLAPVVVFLRKVVAHASAKVTEILSSISRPIGCR
ncbi:MAG: hypothetical protein ABSE48_21990, partial [Verrucomicrobiota bacterium]